jgi:hypothetical protein
LGRWGRMKVENKFIKKLGPGKCVHMYIIKYDAC